MYQTLLSVHSVLRWVVILGGLAATAAAVRAARTRQWKPSALPGLVFTIAYDLQVLAGALLYLRFSPITTSALHHFDRVMGNDLLRFWTVEHPAGMLVGLALAHVGRAKLAKGATDPRAARRAAVYFALALLIAFISTPWPFMRFARPLL